MASLRENGMKLIVTIPAQNEEKTIAQVVRGIPRQIPGIDETEVIVIDDASTDCTAQRAQDAGAVVIRLRHRPGLGQVFRAGFERAMRRGADIIVNIDGDGQFDPADIPRLIAPILADEADFVTCSRFADPTMRPTMPLLKYWGNLAVRGIINWVCGGTRFTDVSCGFRAFNREAAYRLTLFGRYTYTQETFIDLFAKGVRIAEVPLAVRGVREHGKSRVAGSVIKYAMNSLPIILRAMRDIQPLKFFGGIALILGVIGVACGLFITVWYFQRLKTGPFTSLIPISGIFLTLSFLLGVLALLADMMGRHRRISEELLYLARRRIHTTRRPVRASVPGGENGEAAPTFHDTWSLPAPQPTDPPEPAEEPSSHQRVAPVNRAI